VLDCLRRLLAEEGVPGLYRGVDKKLAHTVLTAALMFAIYEKIAARLFRVLGVKKL
jgi:adenine nucleotide transporter 17